MLSSGGEGGWHLEESDIIYKKQQYRYHQQQLLMFDVAPRSVDSKRRNHVQSWELHHATDLSLFIARFSLFSQHLGSGLSVLIDPRGSIRNRQVSSSFVSFCRVRQSVRSIKAAPHNETRRPLASAQRDGPLGRLVCLGLNHARN